MPVRRPFSPFKQQGRGMQDSPSRAPVAFHLRCDRYKRLGRRAREPCLNITFTHIMPPYEALRELGEGGFGLVLLARRRATDKVSAYLYPLRRLAR